MIYLASTSPRRKDLLKSLGMTFLVIPPTYEEKKVKTSSTSQIVMQHALGKAQSIANNLAEGVILGADTIVYHDNKVIGKPKDMKEAVKTLTQLQGRWHWVYTGVAIIKVARHQIKKKLVFFEKTKVRLKPMIQSQILEYFKQVNPLDKAGAYAIQSKDAGIVVEVKGSFANAIGLPTEKLCVKLKKFIKIAEGDAKK